ncbi:MAG: hypothetical protein L3J74_01485 [Bacteroidales bacterium]|nr:hypothetical protein [Bacteroidales bacterium]
MEFYYDLIPNYQIKSKFWRYFIVVLVFSFVFMYLYLDYKEHKAYYYYTAALWTIWAIVLSYQAYTGKPIDALFGKKYIHINEQFIKLKDKLLGKETSIEWSNLESIKMKPTYLLVKSKLGDEIQIDFKQIDYIAVQDLKSIIKTLVNKWKVKTED